MNTESFKMAPMALVAFLPAIAAFGQVAKVDFALSENRAAWLQHPVYGGPSFDSFEHAKTPVTRGSAPYAWPVNGSLFEDPKSGSWYCYVGNYLENYGLNETCPSMCTVFRSEDRGKTWKEIGPVLEAKEFFFHGEVSPLFHAPDVQVIFADGKYRLCFDWTTKNTTWANAANPPADANSGVGYAWSDSPEGPFHISPDPIATTRNQTPLSGKYRRLYASTMLRRKDDWLVLTLTDSGPYFGWALLGMTAAKPEGPYSDPQLLLQPESDRFHPPLLEFFPSFVYDGFVYSPATSVALNRNVQALFRAPLEKAAEPAAWELFQFGSVWHAEPVENEWRGIWGQTFSGFVGKDGIFNVMFPSRDKSGMGTINLARRPWSAPLGERGFWISAHEGPSISILRRSGPAEKLDVEFEMKEGFFGSLGILWDMKSPFGPNTVSSDASPGAITQWHDNELKVSQAQWDIVEHRDGTERIVRSGEKTISSKISVAIRWESTGKGSVSIDGTTVWNGPLSTGDGLFGIRAYPHTWVKFDRFQLAGGRNAATIMYDANEGLLCAAQSSSNWKSTQDARFTYGTGMISQSPNCAAKWNVEGTTIRIRAPRGPDYGSATVYIDGKNSGRIDYANAAAQQSNVCFSQAVPSGRHAVSLRDFKGTVPVDIVEVDNE